MGINQTREVWSRGSRITSSEENAGANDKRERADG
jgi:hypothetical protein